MSPDNLQLDHHNIQSPVRIVAEVRVQAFNDKTLRVKMERTKFFSQDEEITLIKAHGMLDLMSSCNGHMVHDTQAFKTSLEEPMLIFVKKGKAKDVVVSKTEPDCVSKMKIALVHALMEKGQNRHLKVSKKGAITKAFQIPSLPKKINLTRM